MIQYPDYIVDSEHPNFFTYKDSNNTQIVEYGNKRSLNNDIISIDDNIISLSNSKNIKFFEFEYKSIFSLEVELDNKSNFSLSKKFIQDSYVNATNKDSINIESIIENFKDNNVIGFKLLDDVICIYTYTYNDGPVAILSYFRILKTIIDFPLPHNVFKSKTENIFIVLNRDMKPIRKVGMYENKEHDEIYVDGSQIAIFNKRTNLKIWIDVDFINIAKILKDDLILTDLEFEENYKDDLSKFNNTAQLEKFCNAANKSKNLIMSHMDDYFVISYVIKKRGKFETYLGYMRLH